MRSADKKKNHAALSFYALRTTHYPLVPSFYALRIPRYAFAYGSFKPRGYPGRFKSQSVGLLGVLDRMPCWVAPVVAAELWGVSLEHVLGAIADGSIPSGREYGFVVVDVAPRWCRPHPPPIRRQAAEDLRDGGRGR